MLLKRRETDVNIRNNCGKTALIVACKERNDKIVQLLLFRPEIDTSLKDNDQRSTLDWALPLSRTPCKFHLET
jgi:ankyrin repeat protein